MPKHTLKLINGKEYDFTKARSIYFNRSIVVPNDEEISLILGIEDVNTPGRINVEANTYFTLPSFLRTYDAFKTVLDDFKSKGIFKESE